MPGTGPAAGGVPLFLIPCASCGSECSHATLSVGTVLDTPFLCPDCAGDGPEVDGVYYVRWVFAEAAAALSYAVGRASEVIESMSAGVVDINSARELRGCRAEASEALGMLSAVAHAVEAAGNGTYRCMLVCLGPLEEEAYGLREPGRRTAE